MSASITAPVLKEMLREGGELALLDVREEGVFSHGHLLFAVPVPLSRIEMRIADLVPRRWARVVLCDGGEGLAERAAKRLAAVGYIDVAVLEGGVVAWAEAGYELFTGVNVPSKAFGEFVEVHEGTPSISAQELKAKMDAGEEMVVLDSRPMEEFRRMSIPTGIDVPGAELVYRLHDMVPSPETLIVVNCAGRTRSIIGAQSLINAGVPNQVVALRNGTMGWELAGLGCETGQDRHAPPVSSDGLARARAAAAGVAQRFGVQTIDRAHLDAWRAEDNRRTLYLLDVRGPDEYEAGHLPDSVSAPGGQLVQATDRYVGTQGARLVLVDDTGVRATMTASWLIQLGWSDVVVLTDGLAVGGLETGPYAPAVLGLDQGYLEGIGEIGPAELDATLKRGEAAIVDLASSRQYREGHIPDAWFALRSRFGDDLAVVADAPTLVLTSEDGVLARLAAPEAAAVKPVSVKVLAGGTASWRPAGLPLAEGLEKMASEPDDVWLRPYDRAEGVEAAMNEYLAWELDLVHQVERDGTARFRRFDP